MSLAGSAGDIPGVSAIPFAGSVSTGLKLLGSFLKGGVPDHERADLITLSSATGLTQQQAADLCGMEEGRSRDNYDTIVKKYANNPGAILPLVAEWNEKHPSQKIVAAPESPTAVVPSVVLQQPQLQQFDFVPSSVSQLPQMEGFAGSAGVNSQLGDFAKAVLLGAQKGGTDYALSTPAGKEAKNQGAISWAKDNVLILVAAGVALGLLIYRAFIKK